MEWLYDDRDLRRFWADACRAELEIEELGLSRERGHRGIWARLHGMTKEQMAEENLRMPVWASRALRSPTYLKLVELSRTEAVLDDVPRLIALKKLIAEGSYLAARKVVRDLAVNPETVSTAEARQCLKALLEMEDRLQVPEEDNTEKARSAGAILFEEERIQREMLQGVPKEYQERLLSAYRETRLSGIREDKARVIHEHTVDAEVSRHV